MKKILIVEDDQLVATAYRKRFKDAGWDVEWAPDGVEGIKQVGIMKPDVVLLDLLMPRLDGIEVLKYIRGNPDLRHLPVVVFSNSYMTNLIENAWRAGADQCLMKASTTPQSLFDSIAKAIQKAAARMAASGAPAAAARGPVASVTPLAPSLSPGVPVDSRRAVPTAPVGAQPNFVPAVQPLANPAPRSPGPAPAELPKGNPATPLPSGIFPVTETPPPASAPTPAVASAPADLASLGHDTVVTAAPAPATALTLDPEFQAQIRQLFVAGAPAKLEGIRKIALSLADNPSAASAEQIADLFRKVHSLTGNAAVAGCSAIAHHASTFEAFLQELQQKPRFVNASTVRTVLQGLDFVSLLFEHALDGEPPELGRRILVLDGDPMSGQAIALTLEKAGFRAHMAGDTEEALKLGAAECFDLIVAAAELPDMTGFEACSQLQSLPGCVHAPVLYVSSGAQFAACSKPEVLGQNDIIARPFLIIELTLKAIILLETRRFQRHFASAA